MQNLPDIYMISESTIWPSQPQTRAKQKSSVHVPGCLRQTVGVLLHHNKEFITGQTEVQMYDLVFVPVSKKQNYLAFL